MSFIFDFLLHMVSHVFHLTKSNYSALEELSALVMAFPSDKRVGDIPEYVKLRDLLKDAKAWDR